MKEYIFEKVKNSTRFFKNGHIGIEEIDPIPDNIDISVILKTLENNLPDHFFKNLKGIKIVHLVQFDTREVNALYKNGYFYISNKLDNSNDLIDDLVHEFAHHLETQYTEFLYSDESIKKEFLKKRKQLRFELRSEGYWTNEYDFENIKFDPSFDDFLYKRVGKNMLKMVTASIFIRPYAAVSLREYFATGLEAYYLGKEETLKNISPMLYNKINELHNLERY